MKQDTSYYAVIRDTSQGMYVIISHIKGGKKVAVDKTVSKRVEHTLLISSRFECFKTKE